MEIESQGLPGIIQVTKDDYDRLSECHSFQLRGEISVKGKGNMSTYLLTAHN
jgi:adenylate cyclase